VPVRVPPEGAPNIQLGKGLRWQSADVRTPTVCLIGGADLHLPGVGHLGRAPLHRFGTARSSSGGAGTVIGDGLRCASGSVRRLGIQLNVLGASQYSAIGDAPISIQGQVSVGTTAYYPRWYRNVAAFCTPVGFNTTNGVRLARFHGSRARRFWIPRSTAWVPCCSRFQGSGSCVPCPAKGSQHGTQSVLSHDDRRLLLD